MLLDYILGSARMRKISLNLDALQHGLGPGEFFRPWKSANWLMFEQPFHFCGTAKD
jgi:hypothetical protein